MNPVLKNTSKEDATFKKHTELATQHNANSAKVEKLNFRIDKLELKLSKLKTERDQLIKNPNLDTNTSSKKELRKAKLQAKLDSMTSEQLSKYYARKEDLLKKREERKEALAKLSSEEKEELKENRKAKNKERREMYQYVRENTLESFEKVEHLIVDGNNVRGGGPRRHSRNAVLKNIKETVEQVPEFQSAQVTLWFDHKPGEYDPEDNIQVLFSHDRIADDMIVEQVEKSNKKTLVITSDRILSYRLLKLGCSVMRTGKFNELSPNPLKRK